jgi:hypothetical protein
MENNLFEEDNTPSIISLILEILKKYGLAEDREKSLEKIKNSIPLNGAILRRAVESIYNSKVSEKDTVDLIQKELNISEQIAKQIITDTKNKVIPQLKKITEKMATEKSTEEKKQTALPKEKPEIIPATPTVNKKRLSELPKRAERIIPEKKGPDSYREPIE